MAHHRRVDVKAAQPRSGNSLQLTTHETQTDSPILPVEQLERLHNFRPDLVDWVTGQTVDEAKSRRDRARRLDYLIFTERIGGLVAGTLMAGGGLVVAGYLGLNGQPWLAGVLGGGTLVSIVTVLVTGKRPKDPSE